MIDFSIRPKEDNHNAKELIRKVVARYCNIPDYMIHTKRSNINVFFGTVSFGSITYYIGIPPDAEQCNHFLVTGLTGSGKSSCIAKQTIDLFRGTIFAIDIKGELTKCWQDIRRTNKRPTKILNFSKKNLTGNTYDVYQWIREGDSRFLVQNVRELANAIIPMPQNIRETFWIDSARIILTAVILYHFELKTSFNETMTYLLITSLSDVMQDINESNNLLAKMHINQFLECDDISESRMMQGIALELSNAIIPFATDIILKEAFTPNDDSIKWSDLDTHNIFINIDEDMLEQYGSALTMIITQLIHAMERRPDKFSIQGKEKPKILLLLDEFPRYGKMDILSGALSTLRSRNIMIALFLQSISKLDSIYGELERKVIVENCAHKIILQSSEPDNQEYWSRLIGEKKVNKISYNIGFNPRAHEIAGNNIHINQQYEPIIRPEEFGRINDIVVSTPEGSFRVN
ncbi:type IV secretory system conjugative DNA transfer family protein, partial [Lachnospiraceae bacterium OttesenSCG-928-D06]|nr:type IV secretory system conjugative DNA transfer family protein [Lachnospiraceae bacterium OttesenSCG-928-D06]